MLQHHHKIEFFSFGNNSCLIFDRRRNEREGERDLFASSAWIFRDEEKLVDRRGVEIIRIRIRSRRKVPALRWVKTDIRVAIQRVSLHVYAIFESVHFESRFRSRFPAQSRLNSIFPSTYFIQHPLFVDPRCTCAREKRPVFQSSFPFQVWSVKNRFANNPITLIRRRNERDRFDKKTRNNSSFRILFWNLYFTPSSKHFLLVHRLLSFQIPSRKLTPQFQTIIQIVVTLFRNFANETRENLRPT